jgi:3-oxo-5alpha-steroid 4-dehydrogenase
MGLAVGAAHYDLSFASPWKFVYAPGEMCQCILVDGIGSRFVSESAYGQTVGDAIFRRNHGVAWMIVDQTVAESAKNAGAVLSQPDATADTIEALAEQIGVNAAVLANTVAFYNEHAANGEDPLLHKHAEFLTPLATAPFMAFDFGAASGVPFITLGGLRANANTEVVDNFGEVIPGLYAAGRTAPGISQEYYVSGSAVGDCTFWGRVAGRSAAARGA